MSKATDYQKKLEKLNRQSLYLLIAIGTMAAVVSVLLINNLLSYV